MKPINYKALGAKIKEYRKKENITQEQLAEMADISLSHMSNVETASVSVSLPALKLIADALGVTIDELLVDSYSKKQKKYFYSKKMDLIMEQCETVEQEIIVNTVSTLADNLLKSRKKKRSLRTPFSDCRQTRCWDHPSTIFPLKLNCIQKIS